MAAILGALGGAANAPENKAPAQPAMQQQQAPQQQQWHAPMTSPPPEAAAAPQQQQQAPQPAASQVNFLEILKLLGSK